VFGRLPADSSSLSALQSEFRRRGWVIARPQPSYPYITLDESWLEPERNLSSRRRSGFRRAWHLLVVMRNCGFAFCGLAGEPSLRNWPLSKATASGS
jgi:hypothetical protein